MSLVPISIRYLIRYLLSVKSALQAPFQVLLHGLQLAGSRRAKSPLRVDVHDLRLLKMDDHIRLMVALHIDETQRDRDQVIAIAIELRADEDTGFGSVSTRELDHFDTPIQV